MGRRPSQHLRQGKCAAYLACFISLFFLKTWCVMLYPSPRVKGDSAPPQNALLLWLYDGMRCSQYVFKYASIIHIDSFRKVNELNSDSLLLTNQRRDLLKREAHFMPPKSFKFWNISTRAASWLSYSECGHWRKAVFSKWVTGCCTEGSRHRTPFVRSPWWYIYRYLPQLWMQLCTARGPLRKCVTGNVMASCFFRDLPGWNLKPAPYSEGRKRPKGEVDGSRLIGGAFNKQENFLPSLSWVVTWWVVVHPCLPES